MYARKTNSGCNIHCEDDAGEISKKRKKGKQLYMCFFDMEKAFDRVPRKVTEWVIKNKTLLKVMA